MRQLVLQRWRARQGTVVAIAVSAYSLVTVGVFRFLHPASDYRVVVLSLVVAAEAAVVGLGWQRALYQVDLKSIQLTGDPESFISALAESARLNKSRVDQSYLRKIAKNTGVSAERLSSAVEGEERPSEDRYPVISDYLLA